MKNKLLDMTRRLGSHAEGAVSAISATTTQASRFMHECTPDPQGMAQARAWAKEVASGTAAQAVRLGQEALASDFARDAAKGAAIGAVVAVPVPLVGPVVGAIFGAGVGAFANLTRSRPPVQQALAAIAPPPQALTVIDMVTPPKDLYARLLELDDLRHKGILTQQEFDAQKTRLLSGA